MVVVASVVATSAEVVASVVAASGAFAEVTGSGGRRKEKGQEGLSARGPK